MADLGEAEDEAAASETEFAARSLKSEALATGSVGHESKPAAKGRLVSGARNPGGEDSKKEGSHRPKSSKKQTSSSFS